MKTKKIITSGVVALSLIGTSAPVFASSVSSNTISKPSQTISFKEDADTFVTATSTSTTILDFSEAVFLDDNGNEVNKSEVLKTINPVPVNPYLRSSSSSGGSWSSGTGYRAVRGLLVRSKKSNFTLQYKASFTNVQKGYDKIDGIYDFQAYGDGSWKTNSKGVFRPNEKIGYSAFGGISGQRTIPQLGGGQRTETLYSYIRVGNDKFWVDSNL